MTEGQQGGWYGFALVFLNGILRTATPPPRDARHLPFQGEAMEARKEEKWTVKYIM